MERSIGFLMGCVQAIASNAALMEIFRCEIPNLIQLTAEEYPSSALFLRDLSSQALAAVSDKNFNAGLVWYLHDCGVIARTVKLISKYTTATVTTPANAVKALLAFTASRASVMQSQLDNSSASAADLAATAAAVSDALGLSKQPADSVASSDTGEEFPPSEPSAAELNSMKPNEGATSPAAEKNVTFCLQSYDALVGIKSLVYVLQKTCRHSLVLLGEFQSSGGYALLVRLLKVCSEQDMSTLIYLFTLLLPLGTGFSGACGGDENMATIITCGARNVGAFLAMRDLLMKSISELEIFTDEQLSDTMKLRDEQLILQLLTTILHVYTSDYDNFLSLEPKTQTLALILTKLPWIAFYDAKVIVLRIAEYVCAAAKPENPLPTELLSILCSLFVECTTSDTAQLLEIPRDNSVDLTMSETYEVSPADELLRATDERERTGTESGVTNKENTTNSTSPTSHSLSLLLCGCIVKILQNSSLAVYKEELNGFGLLERGVYVFFVKIANALAALSDTDGNVRRDYLSRINLYLSMWSALATIMLKDNWRQCIEFRELQIHQSLYTIAEALVSFDLIEKIPRPQELRGCFSVLSVFSIFIELANFKASDVVLQNDTKDKDLPSADSKEEFNLLQSGVESDLSKILELLQAFRGSTSRQCLLLTALKQVLKGKDFVWGPWKSCQGHETLIAILSSIDNLDDDRDGKPFLMMDSVLEIMIEILDPVSGDESNREYFKAEVGYSAIATCLVNSGVLKTENLPSVLNRVFELITGTSPPRNKIRNADAVRTLFCLLPSLEMDTAVASLSRLILKLTSNDEFTFSKKKQAALLVQAGVFRWLADPEIVRLYVHETPLKTPLTNLILVLSREELPTSQLREFLRVVAKGMPLLLGNQYHPSIRERADSPQSEGSVESEEIGLFLLEQAFKGSRVPQVTVGTQVKTRMASGYIHVVNTLDRVWPPSSGYSFACWVRFPQESTSIAKPAKSSLSSQIQVSSGGPSGSESTTVSVALCEGHITIALDGDDTDSGECYCVLVGPTLTFFANSAMAIRNENPIKTLDVTAVACNGDFDFYFWSHEKRFLAKCKTADEIEMWLKAMQQSESISNVSGQNRGALVDASLDDELLFVPAKSTNGSETEVESGLEGFVCLLSVYSIEFAGCFVRIYFEQATGCLRIDTGSVSSGPNMNPNPKRNSATFKNIDLNLLRAARVSSPPPAASGDDGSSVEEKKKNAECDAKEESSHWHHLAFTHRKAVVGSSLLTLYIDGSEVTSKKLSYPSAPSTGTMQAFVGKDIQVCGTYPALPWSIGPTWFTEEALSTNAIICMFLLGPSFNGQFSGSAYRAAGDCPEAYASSQLDRATQRRVDIVRAAKRLQLAKLGRASRRQWNESSTFGVNTLVAAAMDQSSDSAASKKDDVSDGFRFPTGSSSAGNSRKEQQKAEAFQSFIKYDCAMSTFGVEILHLLISFKLAEDLVMFSLNTKCSIQTKNHVMQRTQIQHVGTEKSRPLDLPKVLPSVGGVTQILFPLLENAWRSTELNVLLKLLVHTIRQNPSCMAECLEMNGYALIASMLGDRIQLVDEKVLKSAIRFAISGNFLACSTTESGTRFHSIDSMRLSLVVDSAALSQIVLSSELRRLLPWRLQCQLVTSLLDVLESANPNALFNARQLRRAGLLSWILLYVSELCNEDCVLEKTTTLEHRWCFPDFAYAGYNELLQRLLALLRTYLHAENHVDDVYVITDMLLLSITNDLVHRKESPFRVVMLQFLLHEIECDVEAGQKNSSPLSSSAASGSPDSGELLSPTLVDAVLYRSSSMLSGSSKKRKDKQADATAGGGLGGITSPLAGAAGGVSSLFTSVQVDGFDNILLEIISRTDSGPFAAIEMLLALRILLSLAQIYPAFAQYFFQSSSAALLQKFKRSLQSYSTDSNVYIPILAYVSNISIKDTKYHDPVASTSTRLQQYALPTPCPFTSPEKYCVDQVWELLGCLLLRNCEVQSTEAKTINVIVFGQLSFQTEVNESFFTTMCSSSSTIFRIIVQCVLCQSQQDFSTERDARKEDPGGVCPNSGTTAPTLQQFLGYLISGRPSMSFAAELAVACFDLLKTVMSRSLFEKDDFASFMMYFLECLDDGILRLTRAKTVFSLADGQKCWLALLIHILKSTKALSENCSFLVLRNLCTLGVALSRYLVDESKHQGVVNGTEPGSPDSSRGNADQSRTESSGGTSGLTGTVSCFGTDVLFFFLSSIRMCSEPHITHLIGAEDQQFVYGCLVYCAQTVLLNELNGFHRGTAPPQRLLDCLVNSKHLLVQQTKCSSVIVCGTFPNHHATTDAGAGAGANAINSSAPPSQGGFSGRLNRMRSLSANAHKEFGIGSESDRSFILSLAAELFRMLVDDSESVRHASILTWQFLIQQRMGVLKELLIVEPRVSLLQNITTNKKEAIDVFHGGFERLLHVLPPRVESSTSLTFEAATRADVASSSRESWLQFHIWLTENHDLLKDLILIRTEPIYLHLIEVLLACLCIRKVNTTGSTTRLLSQTDLAINVDFTVYFDQEHGGKCIGASGARGEDADAGGYKAAARKTMFKLSNLRENSLDAMADAQARWRETLLQLLHTRSVWQSEGWQVFSGSDQRLQNAVADLSSTAVHDVTGAGTESKAFYLDRSIFQQNSFKHRLDYTEGPHRMRIRLVRSYESWDAVEKKEEVPGTTAALNTASTDSERDQLTSSGANDDSQQDSRDGGQNDDPFRKSREFHDAVEVFREFMFKLGTHSSGDELQTFGTANVLIDISSRSNFDKTREAFASGKSEYGHSLARIYGCADRRHSAVVSSDDITRSEIQIQPAALARRLLSLYLGSPSEQAARASVSDVTIAEIERLISAAEVNPVEHSIPSTIFDIADSEFMQAAIPTVSTPALEPTAIALSPTALAMDRVILESDEEDEDEDLSGILIGNKLGGGNAEDSDEEALDRDGGDEDEDGGDEGRVSSTESRDKKSRGGSGLLSRKVARTADKSGEQDEDSNPTALVTEKIELDNDSKILDGSFDYVYGGVARFLQRDDYPPLRCYNAIYIAGMDKIEGIFAVCRHSLYFIGGYEKLYHVSEPESATSGGVGGSSTNPLSPTTSVGSGGSSSSIPLSPGKSSAVNEKAGGGTASGKRKAKDLIRNTLADLSNQFSHSKNANNQLFTVVPLLVTPVSAGSSGNEATPASPNASKRWSIKYAHVKQFSRIKYQLRPVGIEFFDIFGSTFFLQFESQTEREEIIKVIFQMPIVNSIFWNPLLRSSALSLSVKRIRQALTKRWLRGVISNFEYLMHLNTLAGRSFNDITQYPVFPWVVANYKSDFLDLDDRATFRDLSKPMGALGENRAAQFRERYSAMSDVGPGPLDSPAFHYGTHYSCSAYVVNYLIRLEPFTRLALELQGGYFDHADRLFCNIPSSWKSASTDNLQDVRELIPEFFFLPEFLYNSNNYDFGTTQSGEVVSQVRLPPWAQGDPREFIRMHRRALESKYVSENLHHWIDLIFGVKQTGQAALDAQNVFMHVTYEGTIDIDQIDDPVMRNAMLSQIENFGQTPSRIFSSPHPQRKVPVLLSPSSASASAVGHQYEGNTLSSIETYVKWHTPLAPALVAIGKDYVFLKKTLTTKVLDDAAVGDVKLVNDKFQCRGVKCSFVPPRFTKYADWGSADGTIKFRVHQSSARNREVNKVIGVIEGAHDCSVNCATFSDDGLLFVTGAQDGVVNVLECLKVSGQRIFKQVARLVGHGDAVVSVAINKVVSAQ